MSGPAIGRSVLDAVGAIPLFLTAPLYRRWHLRLGATDEEVHARMPGDEIVTGASFPPPAPSPSTRHPSRCGRGSCNLGYRRAGFYTYDLLDNAGAGCRATTHRRTGPVSAPTAARPGWARQGSRPAAPRRRPPPRRRRP
jgi:hypothetical protein